MTKNIKLIFLIVCRGEGIDLRVYKVNFSLLSNCYGLYEDQRLLMSIHNETKTC